MAYISQEMKKSLSPLVKRILKKYNLKGTLSINHHSTLVLKISSGEIDFIKNYNDNARSDSQKARKKMDDYIMVNVYYYHEHFSGKALEFLTAVINAMNTGNHDHSDIQSDYLERAHSERTRSDVGWYVNINIGSYDKPYKLHN